MSSRREGGRDPEAIDAAASAPIQDATDEERVPLSPSRPTVKRSDIFRDENEDDAESYEEHEMTLQELMYSSSSFYAIVVPGEYLFLGFQHNFGSTANLTPGFKVIWMLFRSIHDLINLNKSFYTKI